MICWQQDYFGINDLYVPTCRLFTQIKRESVFRKGRNCMQNSMKRVRHIATAILVVLILLMTATTVFASTVSYSNVSIGNGEYQHFTSYNYELFDISANTSVTHDLTFTETATSSVKSGYCKKNWLGNFAYTDCLSGSNSRYMKGSYTISTAGQYKMFIYNGSANTMTASTFKLTF